MTEPVKNSALHPGGWLRFAWRQLTSMRTALFLLLLLALASVPGSLVPQRSSDPNGVVQYRRDDPQKYAILDALQLFDTYSSVWFSAIYLLLFVSLIGCLVPRTRLHFQALIATPPRTPSRLERLDAYQRTVPVSRDALEAAEMLLRRSRYRVTKYGDSLSAERGYLREGGNLAFHASLLGVLVAVGIGGGFGYVGQKVVVEGNSFSNVAATYDSFKPGRFFSPDSLTPFTLTLEEFEVEYERENTDAYGQPTNYVATVATRIGEQSDRTTIRVNEPMTIGGNQVYLLGNGYAPVLTVRDETGEIVSDQPTACRPLDSNLTSVCVLKLPDGLTEQVGLLGFFYPTAGVLSTGAYTSVDPDLASPLVTLEVYVGDLRLDDGVYALDTSELTKLAGRDAPEEGLELVPGQRVELPNGLGSIELSGLPRFAAFDVASNPGQLWVLVFAAIALLGILLGLLIPRRRVWVRWNADGVVEVAGLARGDDPRLHDVVSQLARDIEAAQTPR